MDNTYSVHAKSVLKLAWIKEPSQVPHHLKGKHFLSGAGATQDRSTGVVCILLPTRLAEKVFIFVSSAGHHRFQCVQPLVVGTVPDRGSGDR